MGPECPGLSASTSLASWKAGRPNSRSGRSGLWQDKHYVYLWADGVHFNIRLEEDRQCILVLMGATADGRKELIAITDGYRESEQSRGRSSAPGREGSRPGRSIPSWPPATGPWDSGRRSPRSSRPPARSAAGSTRRPTCSTSCPSDCSREPKKRSTRSGWPRRAQAAEQAFDLVPRRPTRPSTRRPASAWPRTATSCSTFYDFPAEHWKHLRTTNPIESVFATVRLRHRRTKGNGSRIACLAMVYQLMQSATKRWRLLNGSDLLPDVIAGVQFIDGVKSQEVAA